MRLYWNVINKENGWLVFHSVCVPPHENLWQKARKPSSQRKPTYVFLRARFRFGWFLFVDHGVQWNACPRSRQIDRAVRIKTIASAARPSLLDCWLPSSAHPKFHNRLMAAGVKLASISHNSLYYVSTVMEHSYMWWGPSSFLYTTNSSEGSKE